METAADIRQRFATTHPNLVEALDKKGWFEWAALPAEKRRQTMVKYWIRFRLARVGAGHRPKLP